MCIFYLILVSLRFKYSLLNFIRIEEITASSRSAMQGHALKENKITKEKKNQTTLICFFYSKYYDTRSHIKSEVNKFRKSWPIYITIIPKQK